MDIEIRKLDRKIKERAQFYYLANYEIQDISNILKIDIDTLRFYIFGENGSGSNENCWYQLRKKLGPASVAAFVVGKVESLERTSGLALNIINENLKRIEANMKEDSSHVLTIQDTKMLAGILADMDKIIRLESGQATQIVENVGLSRAEAIRLLADDPFAQSIEVDAEWKDVSSNNEEIIVSGEIMADIGIEAPWKK